MAPASTASSSKALAAILPQIASGQAYEAHQKARTFASRYVKSSQYDTAIDVLFQSSRELLKAGHAGSGSDLAIFLVDVYDAKGEEVAEEAIARITQLIALTGSSGTWRKALIEKATVWTAKAGSCPAGDQDLHNYVGELYYREGAFDLAEYHLLSAGKRDSARLLAQAMYEWWQASEVTVSPGPFALRGTLPYLLNGNILAARTFISQFVSFATVARPILRSSLCTTPLQVPGPNSDEIVFTTEPILNYLQLAVRTCQRAQGAGNRATQEAWIRLCGTYQSKCGVLAKPEVRKFLNEIATLFFAIQPPQGQPTNPLGEMISSLFGGPQSGSNAAPRVLVPSAAELD